MRILNGIFRKDVTYDNNIKNHKNPGFTLFLDHTFFGKPQGGQIDPLLDVLGLGSY